MNLPNALRYLDQHTNLEATAGKAEGLSLDRMRSLVGARGGPPPAYPGVHITGTNGQGAVGRVVTRRPACRSAPTPAPTCSTSASASPGTGHP